MLVAATDGAELGEPAVVVTVTLALFVDGPSSTVKLNEPFVEVLVKSTVAVHELEPSVLNEQVGSETGPSVPPDGPEVVNVRPSPLASMPRSVTVVGPLAPAMASLTAAGAGLRTTTDAYWAALTPSETE
jgi:hypothetical protein